MCEKRTVLCLTLFALLVVVFGLAIFFAIRSSQPTVYSRYCLDIHDGPMPTLANITAATVAKGKSIFFHETSCESYTKKKITIKSRQACSVESAARAHPDSDVYLLYSSPGVFKFKRDESDRFLKALLSYRNVKIMHVDHQSYVDDTYVENIFKEGIVDSSVHLVSHLSDLLRFLTMYKYGGIYLDLDVIVTKDLWQLGPNFSGLEDNSSIAVGVMGFSPDGVGHKIAGHCLRELSAAFNPLTWADNGPALLTRVIKRRCPEAKTGLDLANMSSCAGFKIYDIHHFYKFNYKYGGWFFDPKKVKDFEEGLEEVEALHFWNSGTHHIVVNKTDMVPIVVLAKKFCPKVFSEVDKYF